MQSSFLGYSEWCEDLALQQADEEELEPLSLPPSARDEGGVRRSLRETFSREVAPGSPYSDA